MWVRRDSGRSLILSTASFWRFDLDFAINESQTLNCNIVILFFSELMLTSIYKTETEFVFDRDTEFVFDRDTDFVFDRDTDST